MDEAQVKLKVQALTKAYDLFKNKSDHLKTLVFGQRAASQFWALKGLSFEIYAGEAVGIVGINGSGKSTLVNLISARLAPTSGQLTVSGTVAIIAIGAGLKGQLTGLENIRLKALMQGLTTQEIAQVQQEIIEFADLGAFIEQPVKTYSSGMRARLGFAIAIHQKPDILIIDEALSVGDQTFYNKCMQKLLALKAAGKTIIFVSHALNQITQLCDRVIWLHFGDLKEIGPTKMVLQNYRAFITMFNQWSLTKKHTYQTQAKQAQATFELAPTTVRTKAQPMTWPTRLLALALTSLLAVVGLMICL